MRAADTNVVVRVITRDDARQADAADAFIAKGAWISQLVLAEAVWVLGSIYKLDHEMITEAIAMLLDHESFVVENADVVAAALEQYRQRAALRFSDCLILEIARKAGHLPLGTFDKGLGKLDGAARL
jgi:predicted nucleic-acid-binding protein